MGDAGGMKASDALPWKCCAVLAAADGFRSNSSWVTAAVNGRVPPTTSLAGRGSLGSSFPCASCSSGKRATASRKTWLAFSLAMSSPTSSHSPVELLRFKNLDGGLRSLIFCTRSLDIADFPFFVDSL